MPSQWDKLQMWSLGDEQTARENADGTYPRYEMAMPIEREGDEQDGADVILPGGVLWPTEDGTHGIRSGITGWGLLAEYDADAGEVYLLDTLDGSRHIGAKPLVVGDNVKVRGSQTRGGMGLVFRTSLFGEEGIYENIFHHAEGDIIAHHRAPNQPDNSTQVLDPDADGVAAGLHTAVWVVEWVKQLCSGKTAVRNGKQYHALALNFGTSGDGTQAMGLVRFDRAMAVLSDEAKGPLAAADDGQHRVGPNGHQGGLNITEALFGDTNAGIIYSPAEFFNVPYPPVAKGPFPVKTEWREDFDDTHTNYCGHTVKGRKKWVTWITRREYPPSPPPPKEPPPDAPPPIEPPTEPPPLPPGTPTLPPEGVPPVGPPAQIAPTGTIGDPDGIGINPNPGYVEGQPRISDASPAETEHPSEYGHAEPHLPDGPHATLTESVETEHDINWAQRYGYTEAQWNKVALSHHDMTLPQYRNATRGTGPDPWPVVKYEHEDLVLNDDNSVEYRERTAMGPGSKILGPAWARAWHALTDFKSLWRSSTSTVLRLVMAGTNAAGDVIDGRLGLGLRTKTGNTTASGWEARLTYSGNADENNPNIEWCPKNQDATVGDSSGVASFDIKGDASITGALTVGSLAPVASKRVTTTTTLAGAAYAIFCDTDGGAFTLSLDASPDDGRTYRIINCGSNTLTIDSAGGDNIKGVASVSLLAGEVVILSFNTTEKWW